MVHSIVVSPFRSNFFPAHSYRKRRARLSGAPPRGSRREDAPLLLDGFEEAVAGIGNRGEDARPVRNERRAERIRVNCSTPAFKARRTWRPRTPPRAAGIRGR